jgi:hypothetical protein
MNKICEICGKEYEAKRATSRYCGARCRKLAFLSVPEKPEVSVPENGKSLSVPNPPDLAFQRAETLSRTNILDGVVRDDDFYRNLTGQQAQELLREACAMDERINPDQPDWAAISGARIRRKVGLPKPYNRPTSKRGRIEALMAEIG